MNENSVDELKASYEYKEAREFLENKNKKSTQNLRDLAECYYKDLELNRDFSYDKALDILEEIVYDERPYKTLQLKGAIYKRKWEYEKNINDLYTSINCYETAYNKNKNKDEGYGGINAAYLYDVLSKELKELDIDYAKELSQKADNLRQDIINNFKDKLSNKWLCHTIAQAYLGLGKIKECEAVLKNSSIKFNYEDWEVFTTYKQLKALVKIKEINETSFFTTLLGFNNNDILDLSLDKKGLALSGGGFRASFFHLGTLAKLAEYNMLKDIEVISTVSGGSIIGVLYYLKLQKLLEENEDKNINQEDYIKLVEELIVEFFDTVATNIRNSVFTKDFVRNTLFKVMNPVHSYSRTNKLGELYQERFYAKYRKYMSDLIITPFEWKDKDEKFKPRFNNWRRRNKVPILVINATNLNSGHTWQFQASKMGEPEYMNNMEIDKNDRFDWIRYDDDEGLRKDFKNYSIGQAVACSSAVPGLFPPIVLKKLYKGYELSISDGGVYDNQGFSGLLSEECDYIICSDASGQMDNQITSHTTLINTNLRTIDIQMDRNRELTFENLQSKYEKGILKGFLFTHFKQEIKVNEIKRNKRTKSSNDEFYLLLSKMRTDLDTFSKLEAHSLMFCGYKFLDETLQNATHKEVNSHNWKFLDIEKYFHKDLKRKFFQELELSTKKSVNKYTKKIKKWWRCV